MQISPMARPNKILPIKRTIFVHAAAQMIAPIVNVTLAPIIIFFLPKKSDPGPEHNDPIAATPGVTLTIISCHTESNGLIPDAFGT